MVLSEDPKRFAPKVPSDETTKKGALYNEQKTLRKRDVPFYFDRRR